MVRSYGTVSSSGRLWAEGEMARGSEKESDTFLFLVSVFIFISHTVLSVFIRSLHTVLHSTVFSLHDARR